MPDETVGSVTEIQANENLTSLVMTGAKIDLRGMTPEQRGEVVHSVSQMFLAEARAKDTAWIRIGLLWRFSVRNKIWRYCGEHIHNANDLLRELDLGIKRREIETYAQMAELFGRALRERNVEIPIRKLVMIAPYCKGEDSGDWIEKAISLPTPALANEIREHKGLPTTDGCDHPQGAMEVWTRCGVCGKWHEKIRSV